MDKDYTFLKDYTTRLVEKGKRSSNPGLWNGKMGIAIYLLHFSRVTQVKRYEKDASELIETLYELISPNLPFAFDNGLLGIGCGFEYIISKGFVDADSDEILSEIDLLARNIIDSRSIDNLSFSRGVCEIGFYLYHRLKNRIMEDDNMTVLKLKEYLIYLIDWIEDLLAKTTDNNDCADAYFLLCRLHKLNVFNYKVDKLASFCLQKTIDSNCQMQDNYRLLGLDCLKVLEPWM